MAGVDLVARPRGALEGNDPMQIAATLPASDPERADSEGNILDISTP